MKKLFALLFLLVITTFSILVSCSNEYEWPNTEIANLLPRPESSKGEVHSDSEDYFRITVEKTTKNQYRDYVDSCIERGFNIDGDKSDNSFSAYNVDGYSVRLVFSENNQEMNIYLESPEEMDEFEWPTNGLGAMLPATKSTWGDISWDNSETFIVHVGNMNIDDYKDYVKSCEENGYIVDYSKDDEYYSAKDENGYKLTVRYLGFYRVEISLRAPVTTTTNTTTAPSIEEKTPETTEKENESNIDVTDSEGLSSDFKSAMDSYEEFMNDYVDFMKKYKANPSDLSLLADYVDYMSKYATVVESFNEWNNEEMNTAELAYYIEVQARVSKKLLEVAG